MSNDDEHFALLVAAGINDQDFALFLDEIEKIPSATAPISGETARLFFEFIEDTGLRVNEAIHVTKNDINYQSMILTVTHPKTKHKCKCSIWEKRQINFKVKWVLINSDKGCQLCFGKGKYNKPQRTTITNRIKKDLKNYTDSIKDTDLLFPVSRVSLWKWGKKAGANAGIDLITQKKEREIEGIFIHLFRAMCALRMLRDFQKITPYYQQLVSLKLRHSVKIVTDYYTSPNINYLRAIEERIYKF